MSDTNGTVRKLLPRVEAKLGTFRLVFSAALPSEKDATEEILLQLEEMKDLRKSRQVRRELETLLVDRLLEVHVTKNGGPEEPIENPIAFAREAGLLYGADGVSVALEVTFRSLYAPPPAIPAGSGGSGA